MGTTDDDDDLDPTDGESLFLISVWGHLDAAEQLAVAPDAMENLDEIASHCEAVVTRIRAWREEATGRA